MNNTSATMCMLGDRFPKSMPCVDSLINQVDNIYLCLNNFNSVPEALNDSKIHILHCGENLGAKARFDLMPNINSNLISCDDDLIYNKDYVQNFLNFKQNLNCNILTHHSKIIESNKCVSISACLRKSNVTKEIDIPGAGVSFMDCSIVNKLLNKIKEIKTNTQQTDVILGVAAKFIGEKIYCIPHDEHYFKYVDPGMENTLWAKETKNINLVEIFKEFYNQL